MGVWKVVVEDSSTRAIIKKKTMPTTPGSWGTTVKYPGPRPDRGITVRAEGLTQVESDAWRVVMDEQVPTITVEDDAGRSWTGDLVGHSAKAIEGTVLLEVSLRIELAS